MTDHCVITAGHVTRSLAIIFAIDNNSSRPTELFTFAKLIATIWVCCE
jgi:hypothetical protein